MIPRTPITSSSQIETGRYYALPYEVAMMQVQLTELKTKQLEIADHIAEAMKQSSETWHDNAPADALFHELRILDQLEGKFDTAKRKLQIVEYPTPDFPFATIGTRALCAMSGEEFTLDITGNLPIKMIADNDVELGSISAPIPNAIIGSSAGSTVNADVHGRIIRIDILKIDQASQREFYEG